MTKKEQFTGLMKNDARERVLFYPILMHFAARYNSCTYGDFASDYKVLVDSNIRCLEDFDFDMVSLISDPYRETSAFGARIEFIPDGVPKCLTRVIQTPKDIPDLKNPDIFKCQRTLDRIKGVEYYRKRLKDEVAIMGWVEGPLAEGCDLAGVSEMLILLMTDPDNSMLLLDKCIITAKEFARAQIEAGCDLIGIGDAICSQIDADTYKNYVFNRHMELVNYIHSLGAFVKLHICGDTTHLWPYLSQLRLDIFDPDHMCNIKNARKIFGPEVTLSGNINPVELQNMTVDEAFNSSRRLIEENKAERFILSAGCEITVNTPPANLRAMREATK
jgi:MtaA/CmuA family methyltransferase